MPSIENFFNNLKLITYLKIELNKTNLSDLLLVTVGGTLIPMRLHFQ